MLGQMRQIALLVDAQAMDRLIDDPGRTTQLERSIWKVLSKEASPS
jgi:hypothetical protein